MKMNPNEKMTTVWMRLGGTLRVTPYEMTLLLNSSRDAAELLLWKLLKEGRFDPNGESYISESAIEDYNAENGTLFSTNGDVEFNL